MKGQAVLFFKADDQGWSEVYHTDQVDNLDALLVRTRNLARQRGKMLGKGALMTHIRVSDMEVEGDAYLEKAPADIKPLYPEEACDKPWQTLLLRLEAGSKYRRSLFVRGFPDELIKVPDELEKFGDLVDWKNAFVKHLTQNNWGVHCDKKPPDQAEVDIDDCAYVNGVSIAFTAIGHGLDKGDRFRVRKVEGIDRANGVYRVSGVNGNVVTAKTEKEFEGTYEGKGKLYKKVEHFPVIQSGDMVRITHRQVGRPFGQQRGRRSSRS